MPTFYSVSGPTGSAKTTAAIDFVGSLAEPGGHKFIIAQPSLRLIDQSMQVFTDRYPHIKATAIHSGTTSNVAGEIAKHTKKSKDAEVILITHAALLACPYINRRDDWHLIVDEAPDPIYSDTFNLKTNYRVLTDALETVEHNIKYSRLIEGNEDRVLQIAENKGNDEFDKRIQELCRKLRSKWAIYVLTEQFERFKQNTVDDGQLSVFGLIHPSVFDGFKTVTFLCANFANTLIHYHLRSNGVEFVPHAQITSALLFQTHTNGHLLTIHYGSEESWSKRKRDKTVKLGDDTLTVMEAIVACALDVFGNDPFVYLLNKDLNERDPFEKTAGKKLPYSTHGLNEYQSIHNAAILPALNPPTMLFNFLDDVTNLSSEIVRRAVYHEHVYQSASRISMRNRENKDPKNIIVADKEAALALQALFPGASVKPLSCAAICSDHKANGRPKIHESGYEKKLASIEKQRLALISELDMVNEASQKSHSHETPLYKGVSILSTGAIPAPKNTASFGCAIPKERPRFIGFQAGFFGGSAIPHKQAKPIDSQDWTAMPWHDGVMFLRELSERVIDDKEVARLISASTFGPVPGVKTDRGTANIKCVSGVFLDNDGDGMTWKEFAEMFPTYKMIIYSTASSKPEKIKYRVIISTTHLMTPASYKKVLDNLREKMRTRGWYDKSQMKKRKKAKKLKTTDRDHGFDAGKFTAAAMFYLPAQAIVGPHASFFEVFEDERRHALNPYTVIDKSIVWDKEPEPLPVPKPVPEPIKVERKDPKLQRALQIMADEEYEKVASKRNRMVDKAQQEWIGHSPGKGNDAFFKYACALKRCGLSVSDIKLRLAADAMYAHGTQSHAERKNAIDNIIKTIESYS